MSDLIELNDLHIKEKEPFFSANKSFFDWIIDQDWNNLDNILIQKGDLFHTSHPTPDENDLVGYWLKRCRFKKIYLLKGNHDFSYKFKNSLKPLKNLTDNIILIETPTKLKIDNLNLLLLPNLYDSEINNKKMKDYYEHLPEEFINEKYDRCLYHFEDWTSNTSKLNNGINLSYLNINKFSGAHIHIKDNNHYTGVHLPTRYDEKGQHNSIIKIDTITKQESEIQVPNFLDYLEISYPNDLKNDNNIKFPIYDIIDVPSEVIAKNYYIEKYKNQTIYFRKFFKKIHEKLENGYIISNEQENKNANLTIGDQLNNFFIENKFNNNVITFCKNYVN